MEEFYRSIHAPWEFPFFFQGAGTDRRGRQKKVARMVGDSPESCSTAEGHL